MTDGKLTPALMLTTAKMYMSVKESPYVEEDVKDIMAHLYWKARHRARTHARPSSASAFHRGLHPRTLFVSMDIAPLSHLPAHVLTMDQKTPPLSYSLSSQIPDEGFDELPPAA